MRMKDLERKSGLPRSTIHYYFREGILPRPHKTAPNAASYTEEHLARLQAIARLKKRATQLPLTLLRRAAELMDRGVEPAVALELERAVVGDAYVIADSAALSETDLAEAAGVPASFVRELVEARLLVPLPGPRPLYDATDLRLVQAVHPLAAATGIEVGVAAPISAKIRDLSRFEMALRNRAVTGLGEAASFELTLQFQEVVNLIHSYLFYRWRLHDIDELRRQEAAHGQKGQQP